MQGVRFLCMCLLGVLARVRGEFPARSAGDAGMVGSQIMVTIMVTIMGNNLLVEPEEVCYDGGS